MTTLPITATTLAAELATVTPGARVYVLASRGTATAYGPAITGIQVRGGDVYLETGEDA